jgi:hypothetical protein
MKLTDIMSQTDLVILRENSPSSKNIDIDPTSEYIKSGKLLPGEKVRYSGREWQYLGGFNNEWKDSKGAKLRRGDAAQAEIMAAFGYNADGTPRPEFSSTWKKWKSWWAGEYGEIGAWSRKQGSGKPIAKAAGIVGSMIDRAISGASKNESALSETKKSGFGAGIIHRDEIPATISWMEEIIGSGFSHNLLGSAGKKEWSGDIDIAVGLEREYIDEFISKLRQVKEFEGVRRLPGDTVSMVVPIQQYRANLQSNDSRPRTGKVQVDFMIGDTAWLKFYYHAPGMDSPTKGVHRNILLSEIASVHNREESKEKTPDGRPIWVRRYKIGPNGLFWIERTPKIGKGGEFLTSNVDRVIDGPFRDPAEIARRLELGGPNVFYSFETLWADVKTRYHPNQVVLIKKNLLENSSLQNVGIPKELMDAREQ